MSFLLTLNMLNAEAHLRSYQSFMMEIFLHKWLTLRISPYSLRVRENADQNNPEYGQFCAV